MGAVGLTAKLYQANLRATTTTTTLTNIDARQYSSKVSHQVWAPIARTACILHTAGLSAKEFLFSTADAEAAAATDERRGPHTVQRCGASRQRKRNVLTSYI